MICFMRMWAKCLQAENKNFCSFNKKLFALLQLKRTGTDIQQLNYRTLLIVLWQLIYTTISTSLLTAHMKGLDSRLLILPALFQIFVYTPFIFTYSHRSKLIIKVLQPSIQLIRSFSISFQIHLSSVRKMFFKLNAPCIREGA